MIPRLAPLLLAFSVAACEGPLGNGPYGPIPSGKLHGAVHREPVADWGFGGEVGQLALETRPDDPYSVIVNYVVRDGRLFVGGGESRRWVSHLRDDPRVRIRMGWRIYLMRAVPVVGGEGEAFDSDGLVFRLDQRRV